MDVAIVAAARFAISEPFAGGMEMHTHVLADALAGRGHQVTVYAAGGDGPLRRRAAAAGRVRAVRRRPPRRLGRPGRHAERAPQLPRRRAAPDPRPPPARAPQRRPPPAVRLQPAAAVRRHRHAALAADAVAGVGARARRPAGQPAACWSRSRTPTPRRGAASTISHVIGNGVDLAALAAGAGRAGGGVERPARPGEGAAPRHRRRPPGRPAAALVGPAPRRPVLRRGDPRPASATASSTSATCPSAEVADVVGRSRVAVVTPRVGGAVRARRRRGAGLRHAGRRRSPAARCPSWSTTGPASWSPPTTSPAWPGPCSRRRRCRARHCRDVAVARFCSDGDGRRLRVVVRRPHRPRGMTAVSADVRVVQHPADHPYLRHLGLVDAGAGADAVGVGRRRARRRRRATSCTSTSASSTSAPTSSAEWVERLRRPASPSSTPCTTSTTPTSSTSASSTAPSAC